MATRLQKKIKHNLLKKDKNFKPVNMSYIKVEKICEDLEISKEEYKSYLVNINIFVLSKF